MKSKESQSESMGYPTLEALIEIPNPDLSGMKKRQEDLGNLVKSTKKAQDKALAKQAFSAYTRFFELFDKLLKVRGKMIEENIRKK